MIKSILSFVRRPEIVKPTWGLGLPILLVVAYFVAKVAGGLFVASVRNEDADSISVFALIWGSILASVLMVWLITQFVANANAKAAATSKQPPADFMTSLGLEESTSRPLALIWLAGLAVIIVLDNLALIIGRPEDSLPLGLDRLQNASTATWLGAILFFLVIGPVIEEIIFRGLLYPVVASRMSDNFQAVVVSTLYFVGFYFLQTAERDVSWRLIYVGFIFPLVLGMTAGLARAHSKSTYAAIGCHAAFGLFLLFKAYLIFGA